MNIKEYATYTLSDGKRPAIDGHINNLRARKFTEKIVRLRVSKCYGLKPEVVQNIKIHAVQP
jgi:hypothetical protein